MSITSRLKKWKLNAKGSKLIPPMTSEEVLRQRKTVIVDDGGGSMNKKELQTGEAAVACEDSGDQDQHHQQLPRGPRFRIECGREFGGEGKERGQLQDATDIQYLEKGQVLVTDLVNSRLQVFEEAGTVKTIYQSEDVLEPWASALTPDGRHVAVTSRKQQKIVLLARQGEEEEGGGIRGTVGQGHLSCPSGWQSQLRENSSSQTSSHTKSAFSPVRELSSSIWEAGAVTFHQPRYVTVSPQGDVIVSDSGHHRLVVFNKDWKLVRTIGSFGKEDGNFKFPYGVCTDPSGNILVCDRYNNRVSAFTRRGEFVRHMLTSEHQLRHPQGLALSPERDLYVSHGRLKAQKIKVAHVVVKTV